MSRTLPGAGHSPPMPCMEIFGGTGSREERVGTPGLDVWVFSRPYEGASEGGDVHYVTLCGGGIVTRLIVADVSGHGAEVAEVAGAWRALMRKNLNRKSQTRLVDALNRPFSAMAHPRRFATAVVATYLATTKTLTLCNAGHPRPLWDRAETGTWSILASDIVLKHTAEGPRRLSVSETLDVYGKFFGLKPF